MLSRQLDMQMLNPEEKCWLEMLLWKLSLSRSIELSVMMEMFYFYTVQYGNHQARMATEHFKCGQCDPGAEFFLNLILINIYIQVWVTGGCCIIQCRCVTKTMGLDNIIHKLRVDREGNQH